MKRVQLRPFLGLAIYLIVFSSCTKEKADPVIPNQEELITTVIYTLVDTLSNDSVIYSFRDLDGDGGNPPVISNGILQPNRYYTGDIKLYNESTSVIGDVSAEILDEAEDHQFFYLIEGADAVISYNDSDLNGQPIGLNTLCLTGTSSTGILTIILRHEPDKSAAGVSDGDITNAGGETDIQLNFELIIQ